MKTSTPNNVAVKDGHQVIFHRTDARIAHPFVDVAMFLYMFGPASTDENTKHRLKDRYIESRRFAT